MLRGLYTAAAGMEAVNFSVDTLANNLANVNTVGFKGNKVNFQGFPEMLIRKIDDQGQKPIGTIMTGSQIRQSFMDFTPGPMQQTGNPLDMAINGDGFFKVQSRTDNQTYYTRAGNFTLDEQGYLVTLNGDFVQGASGNIQVKPEDGKVEVTPKGQISGKNGVIGQVEITRFTNNQSLEKVSDNLYKTTAASEEDTGASAKPYRITQGALESSNVNPVMELVNNIQGMRLYEALQKNIHISNETLDKAVNEVGKYR